MRVLIVTAGSGGDINPFLAIGKALRARRHDVAILVNPHFAQRSVEAGLEYLPLGAEQDLLRLLHSAHLMHPIRGPLLALRAFGAATEPLFAAVTSALTTFRPDLVLRHFICAGVRWACERRGVPCAAAVLAPAQWYSAQEKRTARNSAVAGLQESLARALFAAFRVVLGPLITRPMRRAARRLGIPPETDLLMREWLGGALNLGLWSPIFRRPMADDPPRSLVCGFPWFDSAHDREDATPEAVAFARQGDPPVVFSLGTAAVHVPGSFYSCAVEACRVLGRRGILLGAKETSGLPAGVRAFPYARFSDVLPLGCATVHHGGIGSTAQALRAGRPMVVVPFAYDQPDNAARSRRLGVASVLPRRSLTQERLAAALRAVLADDVAEKAAAVGSALASEDGAGMAAAALERVAATADSPTERT